MSAWQDAVGRDLTVELSGETATWRCVACTEPAARGGWLSWEVSLDAPGAVAQGLAVVHVPGAEPVEAFVVPSSATPEGTRLVATFVVPTLEEGD